MAQGIFFKSNDDAFINSAYLSELWAIKDLVRIRDLHPSQWSSDKDIQLRDEVRHARLLRDQIKKNSDVFIDDIRYSMQERLYRKYINLNLTQTVSAAAAVHNMTESRAVWIYKTYMKVGHNNEYKDCVSKIVMDEKQHFIVNSNSINPLDNFLTSALLSTDKLLFRKVLPSTYGAIIFQSHSFWKDYYSEANFLKTHEKDTLSSLTDLLGIN